MEGDEASFYQAARRLARRTGRQAAGISALFDDGRGQAEVHVLAWRLGALKAPDLGCERAGRYRVAAAGRRFWVDVPLVLL